MADEADKPDSPGYLVMARKWRPSVFGDVVGQHHIVRSLQNAILLNKIAGAYLFSGMRGVGKTSMARIFARSINCVKGPTLTPCGECSNCREIAGGNSLDVVEIDGASNNGVDEVREIKDHVQYAPVKCRMKIYIIDEVHMLSGSAFNAFLKTLEEPPPHTLFIFATTEQAKIPETVVSRCQCFEFRGLSDAQITERLEIIANNEKIAVTPGALQMIARRAEGSMRDAQSLLDQAAAYGGEMIDEEILGLAMGLVSREKIWALLEAVVRRDADLALRQLHDLYYAGLDVGVLIREMFEAVRSLTVAKVSAAPEKVLNETADSIAFIKKMAAEASTGRLQQFYDILLRAKGQANVAGNPLSALEMAIIKMMRLDDVVPVSEILSMLRSGQAGSMNSSKPLASFSPEKSAGEGNALQKRPFLQRPEEYGGAQPVTVTAPDGPTGEGEKVRDAVLSVVRGKRPALVNLLEKANFSVSGGALEISIPEEQTYFRERFDKDEELQKEILDGIENAIGRKLKLVLASLKGSGESKMAKKPVIDAKQRKELMEDPVVKKALELFDGVANIEDNSGN